MKRQNNVRRNGAVLLLILGIMAMFAISILTYMVVTSNMAETAQNSAKLDAVLEIPAQEDVDQALKNVVIGSDNERNPIGPFSILENMYGDWKEYANAGTGNGVVEENSSVIFLAYIDVFPNLGYAIVTPCETPDERVILNEDIMTGSIPASYPSSWVISDRVRRQEVSSLFENSGNVMTFLDCVGFSDVAENCWTSDVQNSSAFVLEKVITCPTSHCFRAGNGFSGEYWVDHYFDEITEDNSNRPEDYSPCDYWHFKVEFTEDLKRFANDFCGNTPSVINDFNRSRPQIRVRLNRPAFSGTGAGGFTPGQAKDASVTPEIKNDVASSYGDQADQFRIPFAFWANASAPDLYPFYRTTTSGLSFRSYWAHLTDSNYDALQREAEGPNAGALRYAYLNGISWGSNHVVTQCYQDQAYLEPVRMNPSYTAPDNRTMFLASYGGPMAIASGEPIPAITPSFHRPTLFQTLVDNASGYDGSYISNFRNLYQAAGKPVDALEPLLATLVRKLTPRPLPNDHWNFSGGNPYLNYNHGDGFTGADGSVETLATRLGDSVQWDVDNDGDGVREGVWIPSGLPIRVDKNGTPYATMFSYTVLDLDGRVNINTAGNWDQIPHTPAIFDEPAMERFNPDGSGTTYTDNFQPYNYVDEIASIWGKISGSVTVDSPYYNADNLNASFGWVDDVDVPTKIATRGDGRGTSNVMLYEALASIFDSYSNYTVAAVASNLLWRRNLAIYNDPQGIVDLVDPDDSLDGSALSWDVFSRFSSQPGYKENGAETDDENGTRQEFFRFMDPVRLRGAGFSDDVNASLADAKMIFPYRGKTTVNMNDLANSAVYDFANSAFRTYDPLGAQIYTYAPRYSNNPYLARQNVSAWQDSPYTLPMLERLLRPFDTDANALPTQLVDDLMINTDLFGDTAKERERAKARQSLTTISSDVPAPALVFPDNNKIEEGEYRGGHFGFADLIRRCVSEELIRVFENKGICEREDLEGPGAINSKAFSSKVDEITAYLVSMLPPEIIAGEKIDLNALSQKNYWLDVDYDDSGDLVAAEDATGNRMIHNYGLVKRMERARGLYLVMMTLLYEDMNAKALYDDGSDPAGGAGGAGGADPDDVEERLADYIEGSFDLLKFDDGDAKKAKGLMGQELTATRIAQWCVNTIDFSDPDATMTPFFFDPTPFDGWWVYDNDWIEDRESVAAGAQNRWKVGWGNDEPTIHYLFSPDDGVPTELMFDFFYDALSNSEDSKDDSDKLSVYNDYLGINVVTDPATGASTTVPMRSNAYIAKWMTKKIDKLEDQSSDLGFRLAWGMERPDLVLTETLSFHDLGIADTNKERDTSDYGKVDFNEMDGDLVKDDTFDQVKRPVGSTYLELYCTANPNVPQSRELYEYDAAENVWKLRLSKKTPVFTDSENRELEMPIWRVAISAAADPRGLNKKKSTQGLSGDDLTNAENANKDLKKGTKVVYNKSRNSVLDWLTPDKVDNDYVDDFSFFSLQTRQFRNLPTPNVVGGLKVDSIADLDLDQGLDGDGDDAEVTPPNPDKYLRDWKDFNMSASNLLGPAVAAKEDQPRTREIEIDRIVWFNHALGDSDNGAGVNLGTAGKYPDALRTFANVVDENVYLAPNQYLVVGPADKQTGAGGAVSWSMKRAIGSVAFNTTANGRFGQNPADAFASSWIALDNLGVPWFSGNYKYIGVASNIGSRGLNISEPLWTGASVDPYDLMTPDAEVRRIDPQLEPGVEPQDITVNGVNGKTAAVFDIPFELPKDWDGEKNAEGNSAKRSDVSSDFYEKTISNYPIVQDELFGLGTVPAYKSAFVQRVADPNRPYHPLMNPYITVDWNMMDLTVFTGDCVQVSGAEHENEFLFTSENAYPFKGTQNKIRLGFNKALNLMNEGDRTLAYTDVFSSRQWGNSDQKAFAPSLDGGYDPKTRPNPWARAFKGEGNKAGLQKGTTVDVSALGSSNVPVVQSVPKHTLGMYNDIGKLGLWLDPDGDGVFEFNEDESSTNYKQLHPAYMSSGGVYMGAPRVPFEHLVWNDAPFSNPMELALVPASAPGRFGLEFVRNLDEFQLSELYKVEKGKGSSLGSFGVYGFKDWYNADNIKVRKTTAPAGGGPATTGWDEDEKIEKLKGKGGQTGPYLNFFVSSKNPGEMLNLCRALDFVYIPSLYLGTKRLAGKDSNDNLIEDRENKAGEIRMIKGNPALFSKHREPGKINVNTVGKPAWQALVNVSERVQEADRLPGTPWDEFYDARWPYETVDTRVDSDGDGVNETETVEKPFCYFQPAHTLGLWCQLDGSEAPIPTFTTLLTQQDCDVSDSSSVEEEPLFDNVSQRYATDGSGNTLYTYKDPTTGETVQTSDTSTIPADTPYKEVKTGRRDNLFEATAEMQRLSGLTTTRSNAFAVWATVGYFEVERCNPGVNMPDHDPDGNVITFGNPNGPYDLTNRAYKWYQYYQAIYPDGYTYGKELGSDSGDTRRRRGFSIIDRSIPVDYRRGNSNNWTKSVLLKHILD